jgi:hypothetical protein
MEFKLVWSFHYLKKNIKTDNNANIFRNIKTNLENYGRVYSQLVFITIEYQILFNVL